MRSTIAPNAPSPIHGACSGAYLGQTLFLPAVGARPLSLPHDLQEPPVAFVVTATCALSCRALLKDLVGALGSWFIAGLIRVFGSRRQIADVPWLVGPIGGAHIGDRAYEETASAEGLTVVREAQSGGLIPRFEALAGRTFDPSLVHPKIRDFYERTYAYRLDTWATTYFPSRLALRLLVTTISRKVEQLNFPLDGLDTAHGMTSEIVLLREAGGAVRYTGWFRRLLRTGRVIYTGFYMTTKPPLAEGPCVKVVFPMPGGNATVLLRPENDASAGLRLVSIGRGFGDAGFYRIQREGTAIRAWRIRSLHETFRLHLDVEQVVRCDHDVRFLGLRVLTLHYRIGPKAAVVGSEATASATPAPGHGSTGTDSTLS